MIMTILTKILDNPRNFIKAFWDLVLSLYDHLRLYFDYLFQCSVLPIKGKVNSLFFKKKKKRKCSLFFYSPCNLKHCSTFDIFRECKGLG